MNKYQEKFKILKDCGTNIESASFEDEVLDILQELVDKETPMEVIDCRKDKQFETYSGYCGKCKCRLYNSELEIYCGKCGQRIKW